MTHLVTFLTRQPCTIKGAAVTYYSGTMRQLTTQPIVYTAMFVRIGDLLLSKSDVLRIVEDKNSKAERYSLTYMKDVIVKEEVVDLAYDGKTLFLETESETRSIFDARIISIELL